MTAGTKRLFDTLYNLRSKGSGHNEGQGVSATVELCRESTTGRSIKGAVLSIVFALAFTGCGLHGFGTRDAELKQPVYHVVRRGETLPSIARHFSVSEEKLLLLNKIDRSNGLVPGQRLLIGYKDAGGRTSSRLAKSEPAYPRNVGPEAFRDGLLGWPVAGGWIASSFGPRSDSFHDGIDIAASQGTAVLSAHDGIVLYSGNDLSGYGNLLIVSGADRLLSVYAHNSKLVVDQGERVRRGQKIAEVGATGRASGPHLHFEVRMKDKMARYVAMDPVPLLEKKKEIRPRYRVNESLTPIFARLWGGK